MSLNTTPSDALADAYTDLVTLKQYAADSGRDISVYADAELEGAIRRATLWLDGTYGTRFIGNAVIVDQALEWPRKEARFRGELLPVDKIPHKVVIATCMAAFREADEPNSLSPDFVATQRSTMEKVGELQVQYADSDKFTAADNAPTLPAVDGILLGLIAPERKKGTITIGGMQRG
ncbi:DnaT-like ssDNA-binding protein [Pseudochrobactrum sp. MP213Fo]|uniref:DnaT-like ssDNA-binding protein n=1 Tax=Pseudochrobactrum sp. MP213Fo TaxID=3022250 RepID=UPI003BA2E38F